MKQTLGTQLRHLIELLDGAVAGVYREAGLAYRPRFTPVMRALIQSESRATRLTVGAIAEMAGITQPAATQTIALMRKQGIVDVRSGEDSRQKIVQLTAHGRRLVPELDARWQATAQAARSLDADLGLPLSEVLERAILALAKRPYGDRIREALAIGAGEASSSLKSGTYENTGRWRASTSRVLPKGKRTIPGSGQAPNPES